MKIGDLVHCRWLYSGYPESIRIIPAIIIEVNTELPWVTVVDITLSKYNIHESQINKIY